MGAENWFVGSLGAPRLKIIEKSAPANPAYAQWFFAILRREQQPIAILLLVKDSPFDGGSTDILRKVRTSTQREIWLFEILFN